VFPRFSILYIAELTSRSYLCSGEIGTVMSSYFAHIVPRTIGIVEWETLKLVKVVGLMGRIELADPDLSTSTILAIGEELCAGTSLQSYQNKNRIH
jgi:hypothetical protein